MESFMMIKYVWEVRVLVLYMGGIIGMKKIDGGEYCVKILIGVLFGLCFMSWIVD